MIDVIEKLGKLGIAGPCIWVCYKNLAGEKLDAMIELLDNADLIARLAAMGYAPEPRP